MGNPKMEGSNVIECIPQVGRCGNNCPGCFYNLRFYTSIDKPIFPTIEESVGKIVRVNSGNDSNNHPNYVMESTANYRHKFYNTSKPEFDHFDAPVMFTCNGPYTDTAFWAVECGMDNVMAVRVRVNTWNAHWLLHDVIEWYANEQIPVLMTFMRYSDQEAIPVAHRDFYEQRKHIVNAWWDIKKEEQKAIMDRHMAHPFVFTCGTLESPLCKDCGNCERLYRRWMKVNGRIAEV